LSQPSESRALRDWIAERHYTGSAPPGYVLALEFVQSGERVGGMLLGRPAARALDSRLWLELTRMFFVDGTPHSTESQALSLMRRHVRVWGPNIKGLLAYANPAVGHEGTVYLADGWAPFGKTGKHSDAGWRNRPGRRSSPGDTASKLRFVRTP
jgi:hypothetical protein